jgi:hypothetical protein
MCRQELNEETNPLSKKTMIYRQDNMDWMEMKCDQICLCLGRQGKSCTHKLGVAFFWKKSDILYRIVAAWSGHKINKHL